MDGITDQDVQKAIADAQASLDKIFAETFAKQAYQVVHTPGPDVARVSFAVVDLTIAAPDVGAGRNASFAVEAGEATFVIEARDALTNQLLGRGLDRRAAGDNGPGLRTSVSNRADFKELFQYLGEHCRQGDDRAQGVLADQYGRDSQAIGETLPSPRHRSCPLPTRNSRAGGYPFRTQRKPKWLSDRRPAVKAV